MPTGGDGGKSPSGTGSKNHQRAERPSGDKFRAGHARDGFGLRVHLACVVCLLNHLPVPTTARRVAPSSRTVKDKLLHSCIYQSSERKNTGTRGVRVPES